MSYVGVDCNTAELISNKLNLLVQMAYCKASADVHKITVLLPTYCLCEMLSAGAHMCRLAVKMIKTYTACIMLQNYNLMRRLSCNSETFANSVFRTDFLHEVEHITSNARAPMPQSCSRRRCFRLCIRRRSAAALRPSTTTSTSEWTAATRRRRPADLSRCSSPRHLRGPRPRRVPAGWESAAARRAASRRRRRQPPPAGRRRCCPGRDSCGDDRAARRAGVG